MINEIAVSSEFRAVVKHVLGSSKRLAPRTKKPSARALH